MLLLDLLISLLTHHSWSLLLVFLLFFSSGLRLLHIPPSLRRYRAPASLFLIGVCYSLFVFVFFDNRLFYRYLASTSLLFQVIPPPLLRIGTCSSSLVFLFTADNALGGYLIGFFFFYLFCNFILCCGGSLKSRIGGLLERHTTSTSEIHMFDNVIS